MTNLVELGDVSKARIFHLNGRREEYDDQKHAYSVWLAVDPGTLVAFRGKNDLTPVHPKDYLYGRGG